MQAEYPLSLWERARACPVLRYGGEGENRPPKIDNPQLKIDNCQLKIDPGGNTLKVGTRLAGNAPAEIAESARRADRLGFDTTSSSETNHNPFLPLAIAAEHTESAELRTSIALAFARSPMDVAYLSWDLQAMSGGRFVLGLGSQVRGHIVRRFSMNWTPPAPRMREYIQALRHIWNAWQTGERVQFHGDYYDFNLMPPFFNPGSIPNPDVKVYISAVNPYMLRVAGEVCDGVLLHGFCTPKYTREVIIPNLKIGADRAGRSLDEIEINAGGFIITGETEEEVESKKAGVKGQISFYASTRSYESVMSTHGWEDTAARLYRMSVDNRWPEMPNQITDDMLETFAVVGTHDQIVSKLKETHGDYATSISFDFPTSTPEDEERLAAMVAQLQT
ncbi:MAG: TIGR03617 family F420-dependent LLM class oxidoreductase [Dehalococcoidia bacterium]|nr:TIGR03617 family F420-dependent LLM class oxidoreductase [Dehalococcoidia bacterium]